MCSEARRRILGVSEVITFEKSACLKPVQLSASALSTIDRFSVHPSLSLNYLLSVLIIGPENLQPLNVKIHIFWFLFLSYLPNEMTHQF